jgi:hypothetical protein
LICTLGRAKAPAPAEVDDSSEELVIPTGSEEIIIPAGQLGMGGGGGFSIPMDESMIDPLQVRR